MASFKDLIDRDCGGANPLMKLTAHVTQDKAFKQEGLKRQAYLQPYGLSVQLEEGSEERLVNEFLAEQHHFQNGPTTFHMDALLREMQEIDRNRNVVIRGPTVIDLAENWESEYLEPVSNHLHATNSLIQSPAAQWGSEFLDSGFSDVKENLWAQDFLEKKEKENWHAEFAKELELPADNAIASSWLEEFHSKEFAENTNTIGNKSLVERWEEEFNQDHSLESDLWKFNKEGHAEENSWASEFDSAEYKFEEDNPLADHPDPFSEGLKRLKMGDITNAVLLFEAAVQKDPNNAEEILKITSNISICKLR